MAGPRSIDEMRPCEMGWGPMGGLGMEMACMQVSAGYGQSSVV